MNAMLPLSYGVLSVCGISSFEAGCPDDEMIVIFMNEDVRWPGEASSDKMALRELL